MSKKRAPGIWRGLVLGARVAAGVGHVPAGVEDAQVRRAEVRGQPVGRDQKLRIVAVIGSPRAPRRQFA